MYHKTVLLKESVDGLAVKPDGVYVDVTYGGGGHSREILKKLTTGKLIAFDQDEDALKNKMNDNKLLLLNQNFRYLKNFLKLNKAIPVDGIIADLGVSSHQFDTSERGFSTRFNGELDMRMNKNYNLTANHILNNYPLEKLKMIFSQYGEIKNALSLSTTIVNYRKNKNISTIDQFKEVITSCVNEKKPHKYYAQVFQALRIEVNEELEALKEMLIQTLDVVRKKGRLVVISYHSLEDRLVKNFMKAGNFTGEVKKDFFGKPLVPFKQINKKVIVPDDKEINNNNRARSAKLRIAEKE